AICSEALMLALAGRIGKQSAHTLVYEVSQHAQSHGRSLRAALLARADVAPWLDAEELDRLLDPARHVGNAGELVDQVVRRARHWLAGRPVAQDGAVPSHDPEFTP
ncbi:MAG: hypothetical protein ACRD0H_32070, partial [Actinomycetes bacterium]